jgi:PemK-like, MazF-like toxin of type II toxin-antitoxin system
VTPARKPQLGSVVWAELKDDHGFRKVRPAIVVTATADIVAGRSLRVVAITTRLSNPLPDDHILLPWDRQGKARSGLRRKCAAVTTWQAEIAAQDVQEVVGILPPAVMDVVLAKIEASMSGPPATADVARDNGSPTPPSQLSQE